MSIDIRESREKYIKMLEKVVEAARGLFNLCENDIGMDKPELTDLRVAFKELDGEK